ncbi:g-type lysozyme inhibitor [Lysobacter maris]|uniref:G-type lysozyme inhibitor n=1 Tax=Marilutibacter maris TaxID=1605891 RepID=A0A508ADQ6_9GAMM|nr:g-type lysozyme inhibitor [Lysobacter maris]KAB8174829.1 g-type lysozyme inhibitor [Lysobacter maris]
MPRFLRWLALGLALAGAAAIAEDRKTVQAVHFAKGASASSVSGRVHGYDTASYTLGAKAGQTMQVRLTGSANAYFNVIAPGQDFAMEEAIERTEWSGELPADGSYRIEVFQPRAQARRGETAEYTIHFWID